MKSLSFLFIILFSVSAIAMTEVECGGRHQGKQIKIEIEGRFGQGYWRKADLWITDTGVTTRDQHNLTYRAPWGGLNRHEYNGNDLRLEVDLWPDVAPRWMRTYFGTAYVRKLNSYVQVNCRYPNVH
jgi:hypothetical protein